MGIDNPFEENVSYGRDAYNYMRMTEGGGVITEFGNVRGYYQLDDGQEATLRAMFLNKDPFNNVEDMSTLLKYIPAPKLVDMAALLAEKDNGFDFSDFCKTKDDFINDGNKRIRAYKIAYENGISNAGNEDRYKPVACKEIDGIESKEVLLSKPCVDTASFNADVDSVTNRLFPMFRDAVTAGESQIGNPVDPVFVQDITPNGR